MSPAQINKGFDRLRIYSDPGVVSSEQRGGIYAFLRSGILVLLAGAVLGFGATGTWARLGLEIGSGILFIFWLVHFSRDVTPDTTHFSWLLVPAVLFPMWVLLQIVFDVTVVPAITARKLLLLIAYAIVMFLVLQAFRTVSDLRLFMKFATWFGFLVAVFGIIQGLSHTELVYWSIRPRFPSTFYGPYINRDHYAGLMELLWLTPLVFCFDRRRTEGERVFCGFASIVMLVSIFLCGSRGGVLAVVVQGICLALFFWRRSKKSHYLIIVLSVIALAAIAGVELAEPALLRDYLRISQPLSPAVGQMRWKILQDSVPMVKERIIVGWGEGSFATAFQHFRSFYDERYVNEAHCDYLQVLAETGLIGVTLGACYLVCLFWPIFRRRPIGHLKGCLLIGCVGLLFHGLVDFNFQIPANTLWFVVFCIFVTSRHINDGSNLLFLQDRTAA